ncbi:MAG: hypothetical protein HY314_10385 [Acidobacteria bacterium]|nr:hypothetical protein [Acidobacteriota bacterium]
MTKHTIFKLVVIGVLGITAVFLGTRQGASQGGGFKAGDTIPGFVLQAPSGGRADVRAAGTYDREEREWTVIFTHAIGTARPDEDAGFEALASGQVYLFSCAVFDNTFGRVETMEPQDTSPYKLGIEGTGADLVAARVEKAPASAGDFTSPILLTKGGEKGGIRIPRVALQAAYDDKNVYLLARWPDETENVIKNQWVFDGTTWTRTSSNVNDEDRFAFVFDINAEEYAAKGCAALCHATDTPATMRASNPDGHTDTWSWRAGRTNPLGFAEDLKMAPRFALDGGTSAYDNNWNASRTLPGFMAENDPGANARFLIRLPEGAKRAVPFRQ